MFINVILIAAVALVSQIWCVDINYYLNVRWDDVQSNIADPDHIPFDHGLRIVPAFYVALEKLRDMNIQPAPTDFFDRDTNVSNGYEYGEYYLGSCWAGLVCSEETIFTLENETKLLADSEIVNFIYPNITGNQDVLGVIETTSGIVRAMQNYNISAIMGSTDGAMLAAIYATKYQVPSFVTHVTGALGIWPMDKFENTAAVSLDNSIVLGFEPFFIVDLVIEHVGFATPIGNSNGTMQIIHEGGYNRLFAEEFVNEFPIRFNDRVEGKWNLVTNIRRNETNYYTYGLEKDEKDGTKKRMSEEELNEVILDVRRYGRLLLLMGKRTFFRGVLMKMKDLELIPSEFVFYFIPENGGPCPTFWEAQGDESSSRDIELKTIMESNFLICHNGHNRKDWISDGIDKYLIPDKIDMSKWNQFEAEFRAVALDRFNYTVPQNEEISALAGYAHDSLIWGIFTNWFRKVKPSWFEDLTPDKKFTMLKLYSNYKDSHRHNVGSKLMRMGWPGMFGGDSNNMISGCCGNMETNQFSWIQSRRESDALSVKQMQGGEWKSVLIHKGVRDPLSSRYCSVNDPNAANISDDIFLYKDITEPDCGYIDEKCKGRRQVEMIFLVVLVGGAGPIAVMVMLLVFLYKTINYRKQVDAMNWRLDPNLVDFSSAGQLFQFVQGGTQLGTMVSGMIGIFTDDDSLPSSYQRSMGSMGSDAGGGMDQIFVAYAVYKAKKCALKQLNTEWLRLINTIPEISILKELKEINDVDHENVLSFQGICMSSEIELPVTLTEYCTRGSLSDLLENDDIKLDFNFNVSFITDLVNGMNYIHSSKYICSHGYLKSSNCLITSYFGLKISDFGTVMFNADRDRIAEMDGQAQRQRMLWRAPELLRLPADKVPVKGTKSGDVYSFAIIVHEILERKGPYGAFADDCHLGIDDIIQWIKRTNYIRQEHFRPRFVIHKDRKNIELVLICKQCWDEDPAARHTFKHLESILDKLQPKRSSLIGGVIYRMEQFVTDMELLKAMHYKEIEANHKKYGEMQKQFLPQKTIANVQLGKELIPEEHACASVLSLEINCLDKLLEVNPNDTLLWDALDNIYAIVEEKCSSKNFFIVRRSTRTFLIIANAIHPIENHVQECCDFVSDLTEYIKGNNKISIQLREMISVRAGISSGSIITTVIPGTLTRLTVYGRTCEIAVALRESTRDGQLLISESSKVLLPCGSPIVLKPCSVLPRPHPDLKDEIVYHVSTL